MKAIYNKLCNLKNSQKIMLIIIVTILIAFLNFFYYNYQTFKLPKSEREYTLNLKELELTDAEYKDGKIYTTNNSVINLNLYDKYVKRIIVTHESKNNFGIMYESQTANNYGLYNDKNYDDICYGELGVCGIKINKKINGIKMNISQENIGISEIKVVNNIEFNFATFMFWVIGINLLLIIFLYKDYFSKNKHILTFVICMSIGTIFLSVTHNMTSTTLDDDSHYKYYIRYTMDNTKISKSDYFLGNYIITFNKLDTKEEKNAYKDFINTNADNYIYTVNNVSNLLMVNKISYLPIALVMNATNELGIAKSVSLIICRVVQLLIYSSVIALAVRKIPTHKNLLMVIGILPQVLFLTSNFNYDSTVTGFTLLAFAYFVYEYHNKNKKIELSSVLVFFLAGLYGIFPKAIYCIFLLLMLILPKTKFKDKKQSRNFKILIVLAFLIGVASFVIPMFLEPATINDVRGGNVSTVEQLKLIMKAPLSFVRTFWDSAILSTADKFIGPTTLGQLSYYGWMSIDFSYILILIAIFIAFLDNGEYKKIKVFDKLYILILYLLIICVIWGALYLSFTPVGHDSINGVQNRYFIPLIFPILYSLSSKKMKIEISDKNIMTACTVLCIISSLLLIYNVIIKAYCI